MIDRYLQSIENNLDQFKNNTVFLRLILSIAVFVSHFYAVYGLPEPRIPFGIHSLGWYAVNIFFLISGVLIAQSYSNRSFFYYTVSRFLRVYPAYVFALLFTIFLAVIFGGVSNDGRLLLLEIMGLLTLNAFPLTMFEGGLAGAWSGTGIPGALNSSLWTIPFEVLCYFFVVPIFFDRKIKIVFKFILFVPFVYFLAQSGVFLSGVRFDLVRVLGYFILGVGFYELVKSKVLGFNLLFGFVAIFLCEPILLEFFVDVVLVFIAIHLGFYARSFSFFDSDYSYSIYLFAWPITQFVVFKFDVGLYQEMIIAGGMLSFLAYISWNYVERPCLKLKRLGVKNGAGVIY